MKQEITKLIQEENLLRICIKEEIKKKQHKYTDEEIKDIENKIDETQAGLVIELVYKNFKSEVQDKILKTWDKLIIKKKEEEDKILKKKEKDEKKQIEKKKFSSDISREICEEWNIKNLLLKNQREVATEVMAQGFLKKKKVFTTRSDERSEMWIYKEGIYIPEGRTYVKEFVRDMCGAGFTNTICNQVLSKIETDTYINEEDFFMTEDPRFILVENGMLDLIDNKLLPFDDTRFFFNKLPIIYNPEKEVNTIKEFFETVLKPEDLNTMQEIFGYLLYRDYKFEKAFMFMGTGRNGKGKTVELMKRFIGAKNCANVNLQRIERDNFALSELHNKMANLSADISHTALNETGDFKSLTGHDLITAPRKFKTAINFVNYAKMIFCANELPRTSDITVAFFNRWILIDFPYTFIDQMEYSHLIEKETFKVADKDIINKISTEEELSGLLNWALIGFKRLLNNKQFSSSKTTEETKTTWLRKSNSLTAFCMEYVEEDWNTYIPKQDFLRHYSLYCRQNKVRMITQHRIKSILMQTFGADENRISLNGGNEKLSTWEGIRFKKSIVEELNRFPNDDNTTDNKNLLNISNTKINNNKIEKGQEGQKGQLFSNSSESDISSHGVKTAVLPVLPVLKASSKGKNFMNLQEIENRLQKRGVKGTLLKMKLESLKKMGDIIEVKPNLYEVTNSQVLSDTNKGKNE